MALSHYIPAFTRLQHGREEAVCGAFVFPEQHRDEPSCEKCRDWLQADRAAHKIIGRIDPTFPWGIAR